jgi:hypothetical protein
VATTDSGSSWSTQTIPSGTSLLHGIACPSAVTCYAVGEGTDAVGGLILEAHLFRSLRPRFRAGHCVTRIQSRCPPAGHRSQRLEVGEG